MMDKENSLKIVANETIKRYSNRFNNLGYNVKTLGWGTKEQQEYRFLQTLSSKVKFENKIVLDIGCGFGDYYNFLKKNKISFKKYKGWDINPNLIDEAKKLHALETSASFDVKDLMDINSIECAVADIGVMLGILNFNLKDSFDNYEFSKIAINKAFNLVDEVLIVDFLSSYRTKSYPEEDFVFYHEPEMMLKYAFSLSDNIILFHSYQPNPQKEFMIFIFKKSNFTEKDHKEAS